MNIGFFTTTYKPTINGVTHYISSYKTELERQGHKVFVFAPSYFDYKDTEKNIIRLPSIPNPIVKNYPLMVPYFLPLKEIKKLNLDIAHMHQPFIVSSFAKKVADMCGIPLIYTNHTQVEKYVEYYTPIAHVEIKKFVVSELRKFANQCNLIITPTKDIKDLLKSYKIRSRIEILGNGIDTNLFVKSNTMHARRELNIPENKNIFIYVGRIDKEKHIDELIEAYISSRVKNYMLYIIGDGRQLIKLKELTRDRPDIVFIGSKKREELPLYYSAADAFITASISEVMPLTVLEAFACELPVIGINSVGMRGLIKHGVNGFLSKNNTLDLSRTIKEASREINSDKINLMKEEARNTAKSFSIEHNVKKLVKLYKEIINA